MDFLRAFFSLLFFLCGIYLLIDGFIPEINWPVLLGACAFFLIAYIFWPSKSRNQREETYFWLDWLEFVIELPVQIFLWIFRLFSRLFKDGDPGIDL